MATIPRSDLVEELEKALTDEVYDGGMGALSEAQLPRYVHRLAETAAEVIASEQGEPSDAQILAALNAFSPPNCESELSLWGEGAIEPMRAALRAAGGVR